MKKIIFFLRHNNDIDHITPVLHKWILTKNIPTDIIITTKKELLNDYRIKYLKQISKGRTDIKFYHITDLLTKHQRWQYKLYKFYNKHHQIKKFTKIDNIIRDLVYDLFNIHFRNTSLICFDWSADYFTKCVVTIAQLLDISTVALPHGDEPYWNKIQREEDINYKQSLQPYLERQFFDYVVVPNHLCANHYKFMDNEQIKVLGSPRYCDEWLNVHNTIKPRTPYFENQHKKLKVVLFLRNQHFPTHWQELVTAIKLMTQFKEIFLVVRNHPRGSMTYDLLQNHPWMLTKTNLAIVDDINSSSLIDWSDIVLDVGTSVTWECAQSQKLVLVLDYLQANVTTFGHYMKKSIIRSRDELLDSLRKFYKNPKRKIYKEHQRQKFIKEMIMDDGKVLERYCDFLEGLINE